MGSIATFIAQETGRSVQHLILTPLDALTEPWRYLTTVFPHGGILHLAFNVFWIWQLGRAIESRIGPAWTAGLTIVSALAASGTEVLMLNNAIGLSGVVYAFAMFAWARGRHDPKFRGVIDRSTLNLLIGWFFLCIIATEAGVMRIANGAHAGGAAMGFLLGLRRAWLAPLLLVGLGTAIFFRLGDGTRVAPAAILQIRALAALEEGRYLDAADLYEQLFSMGGRSAGSLNNYGLALYHMGRDQESTDALLEAYEMEPQIIQSVELREWLLSERARRDAGRDASRDASGNASRDAQR
ncbi:rhomboid family intramembrane serine protease [Saltatorellus ferox]|uniref:rhomboid family intramembrane serine protease n=1 Tax=Saltatorellus ferox TaxID=2528018 RepID=UPI003AF343BD